MRAVSFALHALARLSCALELNPNPQVVAAQMVVAPAVWADMASAFAWWPQSAAAMRSRKAATSPPNRSLRKLKTYLGRVIRDIERRIVWNEDLQEA